MKKIFAILTFLPLSIFAQVDHKKVVLSEGVQDSVLGTSIVLKDNSVIFQRVYDSDLSKADLTNKLKALLPLVKNFQLIDTPNQNIDQFNGRLTDFIVNYGKYGGVKDDIPSLLNYPINANVIVQVKDNKYRVIVSEIVFKAFPPPYYQFNDLISRSNRTKIRTANMYQKIAKYVNSDFYDSFDINQIQKTPTSF